jgi:hypothetical protein
VAERLTGTAMLVVTGASGVGKSSLLRAGLLPAISRGQLAVEGSAGWPQLVVQPTATPLSELATGLAALCRIDAVTVRTRLADQPQEAHLLARQAVAVHTETLPPEQARTAREHGRLMLVVDQFEQLFLSEEYHDELRDENQRHVDVRALASLTASGAAVVVIGVRGDFFDRCAAYPELVGVLQAGPFVVGPMSEPELRQVITGPAAQAGLEIEDGLVDDILAELRTTVDDPLARVGTLPLLSHALLLTWQPREGNRLTHRGYAAIGGLAHAVGNSAESVYSNLSDDAKAAARIIFYRLTAVTRDGQLARRPLRLSEPHRYLSTSGAPGQAEVDAALEAFTDKRLLVVDAGTAEIAHDTLLASWPRLRSWLDDDQASRIAYSQLLTDANLWADNDREPSILYRSTRLETALRNRIRWDSDTDRYPPLSTNAEQFLYHSQRAHTRTSRLRRSGVATLVILLIASITTAIVASNAQRAADNAKHAADKQRDVAVSRQLAAQHATIAAGDPRLSLLLAAAAWRISPTDEARTSMIEALADPARAILTGHTGPVFGVVFSPDGSRVASVDGTARIWDAGTGTTITTLKGHTDNTDRVDAVVFSPDGSRVATASVDGTARIWDAGTGTTITTLKGHTDPVDAVVFSPDGGRVATGSWDGTARIWDAGSGATIATLKGHTGRVDAVVFSPDGSRVATASDDGTARIWDARTGTTITTLKGHTDNTDRMYAVVFSPDGSRVATASSDGTAAIWQAATWSVDPYQAVCQAVGAVALPREEWSRYIPDVPFHGVC